MTNRRRVLILCTGNSARSQMAEGLLKAKLGDRFQIDSAGTRPIGVSPEAIEALKESLKLEPRGAEPQPAPLS